MPDSLAQVMVDLTAQGMTLAQVSARVELPIEVCHARMTSYLEDLSTEMSVVQMRMIQLRRLEHVINALWDEVMTGDYRTQGRNVKNLIDTINSITELMDLKKDRLRDEQIRMTQAQTLLVMRALGVPQEVLLGEVLASWVPVERHEEFREFWSRRFPELAAEGIERNADAVIQVGAGAGPVELLPSRSSGDDEDVWTVE
ncbi:hypothetical protein [Rhodococcus qingshengii]|uniref:hypothetical protein n=1 Tax=Rhodococcus qingshengii TaxID=334542 RepID=UPI0035D6D9B3